MAVAGLLFLGKFSSSTYSIIFVRVVLMAWHGWFPLAGKLMHLLLWILVFIKMYSICYITFVDSFKVWYHNISSCYICMFSCSFYSDIQLQYAMPHHSTAISILFTFSLAFSYKTVVWIVVVGSKNLKVFDKE